MGVKMLNTFIKARCNNLQCLKKIQLSDLRDKCIVVDTSIYMYKYTIDNSIYEGFYNMCSIFYKYNINSLFIFDGKPPKEKEDELRKRSEDKKNAETKYNILKRRLKEKNANEIEEIEEIEQQMYNLRKKFVRINAKDVDIVKSIIDSFGLKYIDAHGESDELCAYYALNNKAYAVMSEDMDMFIYGCPLVIRYFSILKENCIIYNTENIIKTINMSHEDFKQLCILSGTDYKKHDNMNIFNYYRQYYMFKRSDANSMFEYFAKEKDEIVELLHIQNMFNVNNKENLMQFLDINIENKEPDIIRIKEIMKDDNFIFI